MKAEVVDLGPCRKRLTIEVEVEKVKEEYDGVCKELGQNVQLPGFRKGRVPRNLLVSKFGRQIDADVKAKLLDSSFRDAVKEKDIQAVGEPDLDLEKVEFSADKPLNYECEVEVKPEFEAPDCEALKLEKPAEEVTEAEITEAIDRVRRRFAQVHPVEEAAKAEDFVVVDVKLRIDDKEAWKDSEVPLGLMEERALGLPFEIPSKTFVGNESGKRMTLEVEVPMNFKIEEYRGKQGVLEVEIKEVKRPKLPDLDEEFVKKLGESSVEEFQKKVRESLGEEKKNNAQTELRTQIIDQLIDATDFELPEQLLEQTAQRDEMRRRYQLQRMGMQEDALSDDAREEMRNVSRQQAERDLRAYLIFEQVAKARELEPGDDELDAHLAELAARRGVDGATLKAHAEEHGELEVIKSDLREKKVLDYIISKAEITEAKGGKKSAKKISTRSKKVSGKQKAVKKTSTRSKKVSGKQKAVKKTSTRSKKVSGRQKTAEKKTSSKKTAKKTDKKK